MTGENGMCVAIQSIDVAGVKDDSFGSYQNQDENIVRQPWVQESCVGDFVFRARDVYAIEAYSTMKNYASRPHPMRDKEAR